MLSSEQLEVATALINHTDEVGLLYSYQNSRCSGVMDNGAASHTA